MHIAKIVVSVGARCHPYSDTPGLTGVSGPLAKDDHTHIWVHTNRPAQKIHVCFTKQSFLNMTYTKQDKEKKAQSGTFTMVGLSRADGVTSLTLAILQHHSGVSADSRMIKKNSDNFSFVFPRWYISTIFAGV